MTPAKFLEEFHYPARENDMMAGKFNGYVAETTKILDCIGSILHDLETDVAGSL